MIVDDPDKANIDNTSETVQDPQVIDVVSKKTVDEEKGEDDAKKGEKDASAEVVGKEKGEEKDD